MPVAVSGISGWHIPALKSDHYCSAAQAKISHARRSRARQGKARKSQAKPSQATPSHTKSSQGKEKPSQAKTRQAKASQGKARQGKARLVKSRQGKSSQGRARARQGRAKQGRKGSLPRRKKANATTNAQRTHYTPLPHRCACVSLLARSARRKHGQGRQAGQADRQAGL